MTTTTPNQTPPNPTSHSLTAPVPVTPEAVGTLRFREAFDALKDDLARIREDDFIAINIDIPSAVITILGSAPTIAQYRDSAARLPDYDISAFDKITMYALAAGFAHTQSLAASKAIEPVQALVDELVKTRATFVSDVSALAQRSLLDGTRLSQLQGGVGHKNLAFDVMITTGIMRDHWAAIEGKTAVTLAELDHAEQVADRLATAVGLRERGSNAPTLADDARNRAFTLLINAYEEIRRGLGFLRSKQGDADEIAPSLYAGRGPVKKKAAEDPTAPAPTAPVVVAPAPAPTNGTINPSKAPGMPGNDHFGRG